MNQNKMTNYWYKRFLVQWVNVSHNLNWKFSTNQDLESRRKLLEKYSL